jgi:aminopeptidase N
MVIAHEMAHMWFGDLVTMRWWNDVWLSERSPRTWASGSWRTPPPSPERGLTSPPREVPDTDAARGGYDDISYAKGASTLRQLVAWLGWPVFLAGSTTTSPGTGSAAPPWRTCSTA